MKNPFIRQSFLFVILVVASLESYGQKAIASETKLVEVEGRKLAYRSIGKGTPIIFVNRFRGTLDTWDPLFLDKMAENFNVITFEYTGIGSSTGTLPTDIAIVAKDIKDLSQALNLKKFIVLGWSYGGLVAQAATLMYPDLITHSIFIGTGPPGKNEVPLEKAFLDVALKPINNFDDEVVLFFEPKSEASVAAAKASHDRIAKRIDISKIPSTMEVFNLYFKGGDGFREDKSNFREQLKTTKTPMLIICGDHDISFAVENWYPFTRQLKNAQMITFMQSGHGPQHQYPELSAKYITDFINLSKKNSPFY
ncbi:alpha/beta fold hydrolase [Pedobacter hiemivivus]|uniref:Alpha/beta hydrolase n=1 Tax=Pedobacter hiemivivus TaxID=2530454 RepID=A0A4R0NGY4_9SPHI|nr:alpha/beta hydrolase [Pedobacter hiemivivus]TCC98543.1 alpha/beta hydrolase [Pedobacter hiemivivus]